MQDKRRTFVRSMIKLAFDEIELHGHILCDGPVEPNFPAVVTQYGGKVIPKLTIAEVLEVLPEFDKELKKYEGKVKL
jgi:hypothetical protein